MPACVYKNVHEDKIKMVQEQRLQQNMAFLLGYNIKIVI